MCNHLKIEDHDVTDIFRIGRVQTSKHHPLIVKTGIDTKRSLLKNAIDLKQAAGDDDVVKHIIIGPHLTKEELYTNSRYICYKMDELRLLVSASSKKIDCICITESSLLLILLCVSQTFHSIEMTQSTSWVVVFVFLSSII